MANTQSKPRITQVMKQFPFHLGHHVAGGPVAEGGIKAESRLAEPLVGGAEHVVVGEAMAEGKAPGLLMGQAEMAHGKGLLLCREAPWRRALGAWWVRMVCSRRQGGAGRMSTPVTAVNSLAILAIRTPQTIEISLPAAPPEAS